MEHCTFISDNQDILKLHALSHQINLADIMKNLPSSIKEASFKTEDEFQTDLKIFLDNSSPNSSEYENLTSYDEGPEVECTKCKKKFALQSIKSHMIRVHEENDTKELRFKCKECENILRVKNFKRHMRTVHSSACNSYEWSASYEGPRVECTECGKKVSPKSLRRHTRRAHEQNEVKELC